ncbi:uncharacterized protein LOC129918342 [Episyrphus balteatus]|uniref:uncharacterized protein LOC129918342 n=1 Tax=Episyrphus balteatus TaxID=286459 RepID=UPI0024856CD0|nr:uncharacterized protein LOC129918342 [Episyrphus balteatus]
MVTCKVDSTVAVPKFNINKFVASNSSIGSSSAVGCIGGANTNVNGDRERDHRRPSRKPSSSNSNSSGFRLLDGDQLETASSVSRNSIYKLKIDLMFDDTRSIRSNRLDDPRGSHRTRSIIMYGRSELASTAGESARSILMEEPSEPVKTAITETMKKDVRRISNSVQAQIERMFTDVAKDATCSFAVTCLGSLPLKDKVTSLQGLQEPLRDLYLRSIAKDKSNSGYLDICATGLRVKPGSNNNTDCNITPFHNIAVWSAVKFVVSEKEGGAAFLPLITDPENIDKSTLFQPLSSSEQRKIASSLHAPIFAVVMRSSGVPKVLECHGFVCKSTEDAIVIAATLYQSLMAHVSASSHRSTKRRTPRNQNGVSCISIASSSALTGSNYLSRSAVTSISVGRKNSVRSSYRGGPMVPSRTGRKKRTTPGNSLTGSTDIINESIETTTEERKRKSHKTRRAPPIPTNIIVQQKEIINSRITQKDIILTKHRALSENSDLCDSSYSGGPKNFVLERRNNNKHHSNHTNDSIYRQTNPTPGGGGTVGRGFETNGDILTRVAIPRSGSFLNTGGLTRYKSRAARRHSGGKIGGGGGSPLGFSELFNEFRLHENLHSLDDILNAIIDADGMSFNDLKPIYKEFLLKLAVTLTKDELYQRSKNIMRRQKKKKLKRRNSNVTPQKKPKTLFFGAKSLKKVFQFGQFRACRGKPPKPPRNKDNIHHQCQSPPPPLMTKGMSANLPKSTAAHLQQQQQQFLQNRSRVATSGSDVSVQRNEHAFNGINRNSSSGYVSCSECSYDSEACTCVSADRCYCSLGADHNQLNEKLRKKNSQTINSSGTFIKAHRAHSKNCNMKPSLPTSQTIPTINRQSLISCKSEDKCYCSMVETTNGEEDTAHSDTTTWCDTDSCVSASKCYCQRPHQRRIESPHRRPSKQSLTTTTTTTPTQLRNKPCEKLALDYELFTINGNGKSVQPHEALSVKKSVEAAALFADVKLSQTTDIKSLCGNGGGSGSSNKTSVASSTRRQSKRRDRDSISSSTDRHKQRTPGSISSSGGGGVGNGGGGGLEGSSSQKSYSADDLLTKLSAIDKCGSNGTYSISDKLKENSSLGHYQSMRAVSASLEDTLGYLP